MLPSMYTHRAERCLDEHAGLMPASFQACFQWTHDFGILETVRGELPRPLREAILGMLEVGRTERCILVLRDGAAPEDTPGFSRVTGHSLLESRDPLASLAGLEELQLVVREHLVEDTLRSLGRLPAASAQSPEPGRRRVDNGTGLL
ncbi:MAG: hypothetical protein KC488_04935 [Candidatus Cloacimonetes bacterium]|nr:hypothetical protein [Candidatus Cloacimonadota bacterium]